MAEHDFDQVWDRLTVIADAVGEVKVLIATCAANILSNSNVVTVLAAHVEKSNGKVDDILDRLVSLELARAENCGDLAGSRRQWKIIAGVIGVIAAILGSGAVGAVAGVVWK